MSDVVDDLRGIAALDESRGETRLGIGPVCTRAVDEIERLNRETPCPYVTGTVTRYCTLTPFTLTDAEREAIAVAAIALAGTSSYATTLAKLLGRLGGGE